MDLILNEKKFVENMIEQGDFNPKDIGYIVSLLVRYLYQKNKTKKEIYSFTEEFISNTVPDFDINQWYSFIDKCINKAKKRILFEIKCIPITQKELDIIKTAGTPPKERLLFTLLVLAKYNNLKSETNNGWVNYPKELFFKQARVTCRIQERESVLYELKEAGFITVSKKLSHPNIKVNFIDNESSPALSLTDMRELGYQYQQLSNPKGYRTCKRCGKLYKIKSSKARSLYCTECKDKEESCGFKTVTCDVCGVEFFVPKKNNRTTLCPKHQKERTKEQMKHLMRDKRQKRLC